MIIQLKISVVTLSVYMVSFSSFLARRLKEKPSNPRLQSPRLRDGYMTLFSGYPSSYHSPKK